MAECLQEMNPEMCYDVAVRKAGDICKFYTPMEMWPCIEEPEPTTTTTMGSTGTTQPSSGSGSATTESEPQTTQNEDLGNTSGGESGMNAALIAAIAGGIAAFVFLLCFIIALVVIIRRRGGSESYDFKHRVEMEEVPFMFRFIHSTRRKRQLQL